VCAREAAAHISSEATRPASTRAPPLGGRGQRSPERTNGARRASLLLLRLADSDDVRQGSGAHRSSSATSPASALALFGRRGRRSPGKIREVDRIDQAGRALVESGLSDVVQPTTSVELGYVSEQRRRQERGILDGSLFFFSQLERCFSLLVFAELAFWAGCAFCFRNWRIERSAVGCERTNENRQRPSAVLRSTSEDLDVSWLHILLLD
jgi:hypothetical protein